MFYCNTKADSTASGGETPHLKSCQPENRKLIRIKFILTYSLKSEKFI